MSEVYNFIHDRGEKLIRVCRERAFRDSKRLIKGGSGGEIKTGERKELSCFGDKQIR